MLEMTDSIIGINTKGLDKDIILGKEIGQGFGKGAEAKQNALDAAGANDGSELVYEKADGWHVSEVKGKNISGSSSLSKEDSSDIKLYNENMTKMGISASIISFAEDDFKNLAAGETEDKIKVAGNPAAPPEILSSMANHKYYSVRAAVGSNKSASPEVLIQLASDRDYRVRIAVAANPSTPKDILDILAHDGINENPPNQYLFKIQQSTATNPSTPAGALRDLYAKSSFNTELAANSATPDDILKKLFKDTSKPKGKKSISD